MRTELAGKTDVALTAVVHALALPLFFPHEDESCLGITLDSAELRGSAEGIEDSAAGKALAEWHERMAAPAAARRPPPCGTGCLQQDSATRLDLLAYCAGCSVNAVRKRHERDGTDSARHADRLAVAARSRHDAVVAADRAELLPPCAEAAHPRRGAEGVTPEAAENLAKLKKDALVAEAEQRLAGTGWLPEILRRAAAPATATDAPEQIAA